MEEQFDNVHENVIEIRTIAGYEDYLLNQIPKALPGFKCGIDIKLSIQVKRTKERQTKEFYRLQQSMQELETQMCLWLQVAIRL